MRAPLLLAILLAGCDAAVLDEGADLQRVEGEVSVRTAATQYRWSDLERAGGIVATLGNDSGERLYAAIGDGFAGPIQDRLYVATGADATFERRTAAGTWTAVGSWTLVEGVRVVELAAGGEYLLSGMPTEPVDGSYRIRLRYYPTEDRSGGATEVLSNEFTVR